MDPPGATPIFLALVADKPARERRMLALKAAAVSFFVITLFALFGRFILSYLSVSMAALQAAGALLLLLISLDLLTGGKGGGRNESADANIALVPLGTPLLAGPGAIVATMIFVQQADNAAMVAGLVGAIIAVHLAIAGALMASTSILKVIKESGVTLVARIAGLLLAAIAVQMLVDAIRIFVAS
ncbi:MAG: NAAT family transporter [Actinobacteria bacterium]|nr:NAAT family transporter [Actinomycetota bacterium]MSY35308.1 NAAT family transporter [Actinomycetota bacterium]MTA71873.1 NAAT family transporter [Actinomycetota bacterium]MTB28870.1 NAAT family transporter [Actinomycetota bacterium]MUH48371.1 NAAT family transporter [Actinomycetota bacterium]